MTLDTTKQTKLQQEWRDAPEHGYGVRAILVSGAAAILVTAAVFATHNQRAAVTLTGDKQALTKDTICDPDFVGPLRAKKPLTKAQAAVFCFD